MQVSVDYFIVPNYLPLQSQTVAQPRAKCRFAVALGIACGLIPTELKVHFFFGLHRFKVSYTLKTEHCSLRCNKGLVNTEPAL